MALRISDIGDGVQWIDLTNPEPAELEEVGCRYGINRHIIRDCLDPDHLPKHEQQEQYTFMILRLFSGNPKLHLDSLQEITTKIAVFYNTSFLITVHRMDQPFVEKLRLEEADRNECCKTEDLVVRIIRHSLLSFEAPALILSEQIDNYESTVLLKHTKPALLQGLYYIKRKASTCKKVLLLTDDILSFMRSGKASYSAVQDMRDLYTKLLMLYDQVLDDVNNLLNTYLSLTAQKTNEVMKILTIFSVFFMPLTFIVGIYGMNFHFMPELSQPWGYPAALILMLAITVVIFQWFKRKRWL